MGKRAEARAVKAAQSKGFELSTVEKIDASVSAAVEPTPDSAMISGPLPVNLGETRSNVFDPSAVMSVDEYRSKITSWDDRGNL